MNAPCFNCKERKPLCHSKCMRYFEYKNNINNINKLKNEKDNIDKDLIFKRNERIKNGLK